MQMYQAGVRKALFCCDRRHNDLELLISRWSCKSHKFLVASRKFTSTMEYVARLTMLPVFGVGNAMIVVLEGEDEVKLCYLTPAMITSKASGKCTYDSWLRFFDK